MDDKEANKIIAEFMERKLVKRGHYWFLLDCMGELESVYTKSLDALIPVWEKLKNMDLEFTIETIYTDEEQPDDYNMYFADLPDIEVCETCHTRKSNYPQHSSSSIQQAAAYATAKAILELPDG